MPTARESRLLLQRLTREAIATSNGLLGRFGGSPETRRAALLETVPDVVAYFADGSAALAADFYDEERELAGVRTRFTPELVIADRTVKLRRGIAWAAEPLFLEQEELAGARLAEVVQLETARPYRDTITKNRRRDPAAVGWRRITAGGCKFCRMLADRGAVYKQATARFAAHPACHCTAQPVFGVDDFGEEASAIQYMASQRRRSPEQQAQLKAYLDAFY